MKAMRQLLSIMTILLCTLSCGQQKTIPESLTDVKTVVAQLDSTVTAMYGWEPRDSTYNHSLDTLVAGMMNEYKADDPLGSYIHDFMCNDTDSMRIDSIKEFMKQEV